MSSSSKIRHEWYQTDSEVVLSVFIRNVKEEDLKVELQSKSVSLSVHLPTGSDVVFDLDPLAHEIDPTASSYRILAPKIELKLVKKQLGIKWTKIEGEESEQITGTVRPAVDLPTKHSYPSSSKKHTNWDQLVKEEEGTEEGKETAAGGDQGLNEMFQKLYANATDDQRRAMVKSYQESNGTALSTDWAQTSKGRVPTVPPDSMVAKKYGE